MDESKKISASKYRNKQRFKNKSKIVEKHRSDVEKEDDKSKEDKIIVDDDSRLFQRRGLESNWYRYELKQEEEQDTSADFSILASAPITQASYFQFKSDKNIAETQDIKQIDNKLFHLDVNLLNLSIATVPFHDRCGIDAKYFSECGLKILIEEAKENASKLDAFLESKRRDECQEKLAKITLTEAQDNTRTTQEVATVESRMQLKDELKSGQHNNELEEWLDGILDD